MKDFKILDFDSLIFGRKIAKFSGKYLNQDIARAIKKECIESGVACVNLDIDINDFSSISVAAKENFLLTDVKMVLKKKLINPIELIMPAEGFEVTDIIKDSEHKDLEQLSVELSETSRFAFDQNFEVKNVHMLYRKWMQNSLNGSAADKIFVVRDTHLQKPIGFVSCKNSSNYGEIVLIVINDKYQGMNLGAALLSRSFDYFVSQGIPEVVVTTHGRTIAAQRFYQRNGFLTSSVAVSFNVWVN